MNRKFKACSLIVLALSLPLCSTSRAGDGLISFTATGGDGQVELEWKTASETDLLGFHLERSEDGIIYERITEDIIPAAGNSEVENTYTYVDQDLTNGITYYYNLINVSMDGEEAVANKSPVEATPSAPPPVLPRNYALSQNYPNPFNTNTEIRYRTPVGGRVTLKVFNSQGQEVQTLVDADREAGPHTVSWDGRDKESREVASGAYFCQLQAGDFHETIKMVLVK